MAMITAANLHPTQQENDEGLPNCDHMLTTIPSVYGFAGPEGTYCEVTCVICNAALVLGTLQHIPRDS